MTSQGCRTFVRQASGMVGPPFQSKVAYPVLNGRFPQYGTHWPLTAELTGDGVIYET
jgi:hypothetical protein